MNGIQDQQKLEFAQNVNRPIGTKKKHKGKLTKKLICNYCGKAFERTDFFSRFGIYKKTYCSKRCALLGAREEYRPTQGIITQPSGRKLIRLPNHPNANKNGQIPLAHYVVESFLKTNLDKNQVVHHIDGNPSNDHISNLEVMTLGEHATLHNNLKERDKYGRFKKNKC